MCAEKAEPGDNNGVASGSRYVHIDTQKVIDLEDFGYFFGKTLGSGSYGKVKAAWSSKDRSVVSSRYYVRV